MESIVPYLLRVVCVKIARHKFIQGTTVIIYADDILLQCDTPNIMAKAVKELETLCLSMGLVINETKTKFQAKQKRCRKPVINNILIDRALTYKYLGVQMEFSNSNFCIEHVKNMCISRLAPLRVLAHRGIGVGVRSSYVLYICDTVSH